MCAAGGRAFTVSGKNLSLVYTAHNSDIYCAQDRADDAVRKIQIQSLVVVDQLLLYLVTWKSMYSKSIMQHQYKS